MWGQHSRATTETAMANRTGTNTRTGGLALRLQDLSASMPQRSIATVMKPCPRMRPLKSQSGCSSERIATRTGRLTQMNLVSRITTLARQKDPSVRSARELRIVKSVQTAFHVRQPVAIAPVERESSPLVASAWNSALRFGCATPAHLSASCCRASPTLLPSPTSERLARVSVRPEPLRERRQVTFARPVVDHFQNAARSLTARCAPSPCRRGRSSFDEAPDKSYAKHMRTMYDVRWKPDR